MPLPEPVPGLVIRYSYLWWREFTRGQEEGVKDRPCAVITVVSGEEGTRVVTVLPITHSPPSVDLPAEEIPAATKQRLGLDGDPSWVILAEANRFVWPGPDLRTMGAGGGPESVAYGLLPRALFKQITARFARTVAAGQAALVRRTQ